MTPLEILFAQPLAQATAWALVHSLWQGAIVVGVLFILFQIGDHWSPEIRYVLACGGLVTLLVLPIVTVITVSAALETRSSDRTGLKPSIESLVQPAQATPQALPEIGVQTWQRPRARAAQLFRPVLPWILAGWIAGVLLLALRGMVIHYGIRRLRRAAKPAAPEIQQRLDRIADRVGLRRWVALVMTPAVSVPSVIGWLRPVVLLPPALLLHLTPTQLELILVHELAHIRRHDYAINVIQTFLETLLFFHPAVWWVSERVRIEREHACDRYAVRFSGDAVGYARVLTDIAAVHLEQTITPALAFTGTKGLTLMQRIDRILALRGQAQPPRWPSLGIAVSVFALGTTLLLSQRAIAQDVSGPAGSQTPAAQQIEITERANVLRGKDASYARRVLVDPDALTRAAAIRVLGEANVDGTAPSLIERLQDTSAVVRKEAVVALGIMSDEEALPNLLTALQDPNPMVREQAAYAVAIIGDQHDAHVQPIVSLIRDRAANVREGAARALGVLGSDERSVQALTYLLSDSTESVRSAARHSLTLLEAGPDSNPNFNFDQNLDSVGGNSNPNFNSQGGRDGR